MEPRLFTTTALLTVLSTLDRPTAWLRDTFFPTPVQFTTKEIAFDKLAKQRTLAPFVSPKVPGKVGARRQRSVSTFEPAYVKPKDVVEPDETFVRMIGEQLYGQFSPEERYMLTVEALLADQDAKITRREEWMAAQILINGYVVVEGDDYPAVTVDFGRHEDLTVILGENERWGDEGIDIQDSIEDHAATVSEKSGGTPTQVLLGAKATRLFKKDANIREILDNRRQLGGRMELGPIALGGQGNVAAYLGSIGQFDFWTYSQNYVDEAGVTQPMFSPYGMLLVAPDAYDGAMTHGAIQDLAALQALSRFPKMWDEKDPSAAILMTQSAPLPVPINVDATSYVEVAVPA